MYTQPCKHFFPNGFRQSSNHTPLNIEQVSHTTFLGVIIDENLTWREQTKTVETKVSTSIGVLYKTKDVLDIQALRTLYQLLVEPYMSYCCEILGNTYASRLRKNSLCCRKKLYE